MECIISSRPLHEMQWPLHVVSNILFFLWKNEITTVKSKEL